MVFNLKNMQNRRFLKIFFKMPNKKAFSCVYYYTRIFYFLKNSKKGGGIINLSDLIKSIANGDKAAFEQLYEHMSGDVYTFLCMFTKDEYIAEDALHDTFLSIYENAGKYTVFENPKAWILTIAKNKAISIIRKNARTVPLEAREISVENVEDFVVGQMQADMLLALLSEEDKKIVVLHSVYGFKHREIAEFLGLPLGTVTRRYKQSIDKMKQKDKIDKNNEEDMDLSWETKI